MTFAAGITFVFSLLAIILLFLIKKYEVRRGRLIGGALRTRADDFALDVKWVFMVIEWYLARVPDFVILLTRLGLRKAALRVARVARTSEEHAHRVADLVSHKRNFERRETKSDYLKHVGERPLRLRGKSEPDDRTMASS